MNPKQFMASATSMGISLLLGSAAMAQTYTFVDLGVFNGTALNSSGQVAGTTYVNPHTLETVASYTGANGLGMTTLSPPAGGYNMKPTGISDTGQVVGSNVLIRRNGNGDQDTNGFFTAAQGESITTIRNRSSHGSWAQVGAISSNGKMVVNDFKGSYIMNADGTGITALSSIRDGTNVANAINANGQVVGVSYSFLYGNHAFMTGSDGSGTRDLGTLGGDLSEARAINTIGTVVGNSRNSNNQNHAFFTDAQGLNMRDLGTFGGRNSQAFGVNDLGQVVGEATLAVGEEFHSFITATNGQGLFDLNALVCLPGGDKLNSAVAINNAGQILATSFWSGKSYLLTLAPGQAPVPEAQTSALMLLGFGALGLAVRRQKQRQ